MATMNEIFSRNLRNALYLAGMTQAELSRAVGVTETSVSSWIGSDEYKEKTSELQKKIADLSKAPSAKPVQFVSGWRDLYQTLTDENKRAFWRRLIKGVIIDEQGQPKEILY